MVLVAHRLGAVAIDAPSGVEVDAATTSKTPDTLRPGCQPQLPHSRRGSPRSTTRAGREPGRTAYWERSCAPWNASAFTRCTNCCVIGSISADYAAIGRRIRAARGAG